MFKKTFLAVIGLTAHGLAFSGTMGPVCTPDNVTVPCEAQRWSIGADALYFKLTNGDARGYDVGSATALNDDWSWGFQINAAYQFNTGNDLSVNWIHITESNNYSFLTIDPTNPSVNFYNNNSFDQVNAVMGQLANVGALSKIRLYGGLSYANIENKHSFYNQVFATVPRAHSFDNSTFDGVGPVIGVDYSYDISGGLSAIANSAASLLYGTTSVTSWIVRDSDSVILVPRNSSENNVVPGFEAKLGLNYAYGMMNGTLNIEGGYQVIQYLAPLRELRSNTVRESNFGMYGPYVGAKYVGNV